ncbi:MBOAT family O-acyltransferase [Limibacter armeniacum]|uniref:MBOAT family O-acyltransferase n=1 Tax=Limibacter armeniacum TaxID=466084 RepID=UPI002FE68779
MLFNSIDFAFFLPIVFILYWFVFNKSLKAQNAFLLLCSYIFYGWWDVRFLSLIAFSSLVDYSIGRKLSHTEAEGKRKILLFLSLAINLGFLGVFKYYNFFAESFADAFSLMGKNIDAARLNIILPVGISFYTFQTLSYSIDVYRRKLQPSSDIISFFTFVSFFPQLVAGPIERATNLLPQFERNRQFDYAKAVDGMRQILWGLFKKIVIADNCAMLVNDIFANYTEYSGSTLLLGAFFFAFQIYGDFSGYSDIAIGCARLFGFNFMRNFAFPYFSRDIAEFWRRWHISLSTWFRDYLYIPLGGSKGGSYMKLKNTFIIFIVSGFWHGANWTFVVWGFLNALFFLPLLLAASNRNNIDTLAKGKLLPSFKELLGVVSTFALTLLAWIFFRAADISTAFAYIDGIFSKSFFSIPEIDIKTLVFVLIHIVLLLMVEWLQREKEHGLEFKNLSIPKPFRWSMYIMLSFYLLTFGIFEETEFIYFAF